MESNITEILSNTTSVVQTPYRCVHTSSPSNDIHCILHRVCITQCVYISQLINKRINYYQNVLKRIKND